MSTVDPEATRAGLRVLRRGGNAVDAAVAAAATLGVTEPYSAGIGGGGFFMYYDAQAKKVRTIDGRETAPHVDPADTYRGLTFDEAVTSGLSVGVPGSPRTWAKALHRWGTLSLAQALPRPTGRPPRLRRRPDLPRPDRGQRGAVPRHHADQRPVPPRWTAAGRRLGVPQPATSPTPTTGSAARASDWLYDGGLGREIVSTVQQPPKDPASTRNVRPGLMTRSDLASYTAPRRQPTSVGYRGLKVWGMAPPSSGGSTVGEALNILENVDLAATYRADRTKALHDYLEASALAFADRGAVRRCSFGDAARRPRPGALAGVRRRAVLRAGPDQGRDQAGARGLAGRLLRDRAATARRPRRPPR